MTGETDTDFIQVGDRVRVNIAAEAAGSIRRYERCQGRTGEVTDTGTDFVPGGDRRLIYRVEVDGVAARYWFDRDELLRVSELACRCGAYSEYGWAIAPGEDYETFWQYSSEHGAFVDDPLEDRPRALTAEELENWRECPGCGPPIVEGAEPKEEA